MRKMMSMVLGGSLTLVLAAGSLAVAQDAGKAEEAFKKIDKNGDGKLTLDEFKDGKEGKKLEGAEKRFKAMDKDSDGSVSLEEFKAGFTKKKKE